MCVVCVCVCDSVSVSGERMREERVKRNGFNCTLISVECLKDNCGNCVCMMYVFNL